MQHRFRRAAFFAGASGFSLLLAAPAMAQNISTMGSWNGSTFISAWGEPNTATYGQTITATAGQRTLRNFTFQLNQSSGTPPNYTAYVYAWDSVNSRITGSPLFQSESRTAPTTGAGIYQTVSFDTVAALTAGQQYVLLLTTSADGVQPEASYRYGSVGSNTAYTGGQFVFQNNGDIFGNLSTVGWSTIAQDLAFTAAFTHPIDDEQNFYLSSALALDLEPNFQGGRLRLDTTSFTQNFHIGADGGSIDPRGLTATFSGVLSGPGRLVFTSGIAGGSVTLSGANTYSGGTSVREGITLIVEGAALHDAGRVDMGFGTLVVAASETIGSLDGSGAIILAAGQTLTTGGDDSSSFFQGIISGGGSLTKAGSGVMGLQGANTYTGATIINGGSLSLFGNAWNATGAVTVNAGGILQLNGFGNNTLGSSGVVNHGALVVRPGGTFAYGGVISGSGSVTAAGLGTLILSGANSYTGGTIITAGTLQVGGGGTSGAIAGNVANAGTLAFNRSDAVTFSGVISGAGAVTKAGAGVLTLSGANTYTGATTVNGGTLLLNGSLASATTVASGATLAGAGTLGGATAIQSGGGLSPGAAAGATGTLTVNGNLALQSGSTYGADITPGAADRVTVSGTATIAGNLIASFQGGAYSTSNYTLLSAAGGISGTFASFNMPGLPAGFRARLNYDANTVSLQLQRSELVPLLGSGTLNQVNLARGIDNAVLSGAVPSSAFQPLYDLTGTGLGAALDQLSGQINGQIGEVVWNNYLSFLQLMMGAGGTGGAGGSALYAPGKSYAAADAPQPAQLAPGELHIWGAVFGGGGSIARNAATGAAGLDSSFYRFAAGLTYAAGDGLLLGGGIAAGQDAYDAGNGHARNGDLSLGFHARQSLFGSGYLSAALGFGWTGVKTDRTVTLSGIDVLQGKLDAETAGGRIEAGYGIALDGNLDLTPFAAFTGASFETPAYSETAIGGSNAFALAYTARSSLLANSELGARLGRNFDLGGNPARIELLAGWTHSYNDGALTTASFAALANSGFQSLGANQARDAGLLGITLEGRTVFGLTYGLQLDSRLGDGSSIVTGSGRIGWAL
jgi:autotransporter-associated beta strand protein